MADIEAAFLYLARRIADTARELPELPPLDTPSLRFPAVFAVFDELLSRPSRGAHEQLIFAALLEAWRLQMGEAGVVETKHVNASDTSSGTAADVQERYRGQVTEAYEVTAAAWQSKIGQALAVMRAHDLARVHVVARHAAQANSDELSRAIPDGVELVVLDVREEVRSLTGRLTRPLRRSALERLYWLLIDKQPDDALVRAYVEQLERRGVIEAA